MYTITKKGEVFSAFADTNKPRKLYKTAKGYLAIRVKNIDASWSTYLVHRLVMHAHSKEYTEELQVDHIDGNKQNNNLNNLRMITNADNQKHAIFLGKKPANAKKIQKLTLTGRYIETFSNGTLAGKSVNKGSANILRVCRGARPTAFGFKWRFEE